jgi:hypothetical protein
MVWYLAYRVPRLTHVTSWETQELQNIFGISRRNALKSVSVEGKKSGSEFLICFLTLKRLFKSLV